MSRRVSVSLRPVRKKMRAAAYTAGGVDWEASDPRGRSALHLAVAAGHAVGVEMLITRGANISAADGGQATPMQLAAEGGRDDLVTVMLEYKLAQDEKRLAQHLPDVGDED